MKRYLNIFFIVLTISGCTDIDLSEDDHSVFITGKAIKELPCDSGMDEEYGKKRKIAEGLGTYSIQYIFDSSKNNQLQCPMRVYTRIRVSANHAEAIKDYEKTLSSAKTGINISGSKLLLDNKFYSYGEKSDFHYIMHNNKKVGIYFISKVKNITYAVNLWPMILDKPERFKKIIEKRINYVVNNSERYSGA